MASGGTGMSSGGGAGIGSIRPGSVALGAGTGGTVVFTIDSNEYKVGDNTFTSDHVPYLDAQNRAMVPLLAFAKAQGADARMEWNASDQSITIFQANRTTIKVVVGQMSYWLNGTQIPMDTAAVMKDGEIFLPVRAVGQAMGKIISWDNATRSVIITP